MNREKLIARIRELSQPMEPMETDQREKLAALNGIRCVALDFYGTMFISGVGDIGIDEKQGSNSVRYFENSLIDSGLTPVNDSVGRQGIKQFEKEIEEYQSSHRKKGIDYPEPNIIHIWYDVLTSLKDRDLIEGTINRGISERFAVEFEFRMNPIWPMPDLTSTLQEIADRNILLGIISNSQFYTPLAFEALTGMSLDETGFDPHLMVWSYRASVKKPSIDLYHEFLKSAKKSHWVDPAQILFAGNDLLKDIKPAKELGMCTALFAGDKRSLKLYKDNEDTQEVYPDITINELGQLLACID